MAAARQRRGRSRRAQQPASLTPPQLVGARSTVSFFTIDLEAERLGVLHELVPEATAIAVLVDRTQGKCREPVEGAQRGRPHARTAASRPQRQQRTRLEVAFAAVAQMRAGAPLVAADPLCFHPSRKTRLPRDGSGGAGDLRLARVCRRLMRFARRASTRGGFSKARSRPVCR